jgi:hypothetical protein
MDKSSERFYVRYLLLEGSEVHEFKFPRRTRAMMMLPRLYECTLPIPTKKYCDLQRLCLSGVIPAQFREEYLSLRSDVTTVDLLPETDEEDDDDDE